MMNQPVSEEITQAAEFIQQGNASAARAVLAEYLKKNPRSDQAWFLLSYVVNDQAQRMDCLRRALQINPNHTQARTKLARIQIEILTSGEERPVAPAPQMPSFIDGIPTQADETPEQAAEQRPASISRSAAEESWAARPAPKPEIEFQEGPSKQIKTVSQEIVEEKDRFKTSVFHRLLRGPQGETQADQSVVQKGSIFWKAFGIISFMIVIGVVGIFMVFRSKVQPTAQATIQTAASPAITSTSAALPASGTAIPTPVIASTNQPIPTETVLPTPSFIELNPADVTLYKQIEIQVSELRDLPESASVTPYLIDAGQAQGMLKGQITADKLEELQQERRVYAVLGLIPPAYDLVNYSINQMADNMGGFYLPSEDQIFILGSEFGGLERLIFSQEYAHALIHQNYADKAYTVDTDCTSNQEACAAYNALIEGDAAFVMYQWWDAYSSTRDTLDLKHYQWPVMAFPEDKTPPFIKADLAFSSTYGMNFVNYLYQRGEWTRIDNAYANPPTTTEQIMHPVKYINEEGAEDVSAPDLSSALGSGWTLQANNILGEWFTYLVLGSSADYADQLDDEAAKTAAAGWGGDRYQVYYNEANDSSVLAAAWVWESRNEANQFSRALAENLDIRFKNGRIENETEDCWKVPAQMACVFTVKNQTLWIIAPDSSTLDAVRGQYPDFQ